METKHFEFIDALRGYAILGVMVVHTSQAAPDLLGVGRLLVDQGARGVQLFFIASALTLVLSWNARNDGVIPFYLRRLFRIAPMFWLGILFFLCLDGFGPRYFAPNGIDIFSVLLTIFFLHGWIPDTITSVVPGGWSIAVEMTFYFVFPLFMLLIRGWRSAFSFFLLSVFLSKIVFDYLWNHRVVYWPDVSDALVSAFLNLWFPTQLPVFAVGFLLFFFIRDCKGFISKPWLNALLFASVLSMVALALRPELAGKLRLNTYTAYGVCFSVFAFCLADGAARWLVVAPVRYLGKISFSAYLWHFAVLGTLGKLAAIGINPLSLMTPTRGTLFFFELFVYVVLATGILSALTYKFIERPMIKVGNKIISYAVIRRS
ncbi:MAG: acyltransferase [Hyphomicrobiales bacterium]|nr:acyltransferase [Hyphomicrobiales bacterium]